MFVYVDMVGLRKPKTVQPSATIGRELSPDVLTQAPMTLPASVSQTERAAPSAFHQDYTEKANMMMALGIFVQSAGSLLIQHDVSRKRLRTILDNIAWIDTDSDSD